MRDHGSRDGCFLEYGRGNVTIIGILRFIVPHSERFLKARGYLGVTRKVAYRGIAKNMNRFHVLFGCANLLMCIRAGRTEQFRNKQVAPIAG